MGRGNIAGKVTGYELDGPGFEFRWWRDFPHTSRQALLPLKTPIEWAPVRFQTYSCRGVALNIHRF